MWWWHRKDLLIFEAASLWQPHLLSTFTAVADLYRENLPELAKQHNFCYTLSSRLRTLYHKKWHFIVYVPFPSVFINISIPASETNIIPRRLPVQPEREQSLQVSQENISVSIFLVTQKDILFQPMTWCWFYFPLHGGNWHWLFAGNLDHRFILLSIPITSL